jgi:hypothetical protein
MESRSAAMPLAIEIPTAERGICCFLPHDKAKKKADPPREQLARGMTVSFEPAFVH